MKKNKTKQISRWVYPPQPYLRPNQSLSASRVLSVLLAPGEKVNWIWSVTFEGIRYVSGYEIIK
jgi:hypothetical protein